MTGHAEFHTDVVTPSAWDRRRPIARSIIEVRVRQSLWVTGTVGETTSTTFFGRPALRCQLDDGSGRIGLLFLGRSRVAGIEDGRRCTIKGTARGSGAGLVVGNPQFQIE